jgi:uncharacterized membrane protein
MGKPAADSDYRTDRDRFTARLEAFSDLVFGFSLSLLATRLDVPARVEEVFEPGRWLAIIITFGLVCRFWLEHYRIFRHRFVAGMFDAVVNFIFLFGIAILPYAVQTFLRFHLGLTSFGLYVSDFCLILVALGTLRVRSLWQRRAEPEPEARAGEWRRSLLQFAIAILMVALLLGLKLHGGTFNKAMGDLDGFVMAAFFVILVFIRWRAQRLPGFLGGKPNEIRATR